MLNERKPIVQPSTTGSSGSPLNGAICGLAVACAIASLTLLLVRLWNSTSLTEPLQLVTSGWEQESLAAIWDAANGGAAYVSRWEVPFRWAIYNWLFYDTYTLVWSQISGLLDLKDPWLPTVTRLFTVLGAAVGVAAAYRVFGLAGGIPENRIAPLAGGFAVLVAAGPLIGYWGLTTRPDVWALSLEISAVTAFVVFSRRKGPLALLAFCLLAYGAWAFKQSSVGAVGAVGLLLLFRRRWTDLGLLVAIMIGAWAATLWIGGPVYRDSVLLHDYHPTLSAAHSLQVLMNAAPKSLPALIGVAAIVYSWFRFPQIRTRLKDNDVFFIGAAGLLVGGGLALAAGMQPGAAENYYFSPLFFAALMVVAAFQPEPDEVPWRPVIHWGQALGWSLQCIALAAVLIGAVGTTSVRYLHDSVMERQACLTDLPRPLFVNDEYLSLPWMTPGTPSFVLFYGYMRDRETVPKHDRGGIGGLIEAGYFKSLAFGHDPKGVFDGAALDRYQQVGEACAGMKIFQRR